MTIRKDGRSTMTAYEVKSSGEMNPEMREIVEAEFGGNDGSYFIHSETTLETPDRSDRFKVLFVEDCKGNKHTIYFKISG